MTRHLRACEKRKAALEKSEKKGRKKQAIFHLVVEGRDRPMYWLHVETRAGSTFGDLDLFLRDIWLECCGHLSNFTFREEDFDEDDFDNFEGSSPFGPPGSKVTAKKLADRVKPGDVFFYEYDFGSTTALKLKVVGHREGVMKKGDVQVLARNLPPEIACDCGKPAVLVCTECMWDEAGWLCKSCAKNHECGDDILLPVVNSPRVGVCGYTG